MLSRLRSRLCKVIFRIAVIVITLLPSGVIIGTVSYHVFEQLADYRTRHAGSRITITIMIREGGISRAIPDDRPLILGAIHLC